MADPQQPSQPRPAENRTGLVRLHGVDFDALTEDGLCRLVETALSRPVGQRRGGWIVTPNVDILRMITRRPEVRALVDRASSVVADGMPIIWASKLQGTPLPERVTGASLIWSLTRTAAAHGRSAYLLGGGDGIAGVAADRLRTELPGLRVAGWSPPFGVESTDAGRAEFRSRIRAAQADLVFCGFGSPKELRVIADLVDEFPDVWFIGCGAAVDFVAGQVSRAPAWMQRSGLEWVYRLSREPRRMARRYLIDDIPFALLLLARSALRRTRGARVAH